jgi:hypothetical protein
MKRGQRKVSKISLGRKNLIIRRLSPLEVGQGPISKNQEKSSSYPWLISSYKHESLKLHANIKFKPFLHMQIFGFNVASSNNVSLISNP